MATHSHTRRAIFGAMALAPIVLVAPAAAAKASPSTAAWDAAFAEYQDTVANCERCEWSWEATDIENASWRRLMFVPAPHATALHWKLDYLFGSSADEDGYCASWRADIVAFVVSDAKRLAA